MLHTFKCRDCGTLNNTTNPAKKVCSKCSLNHDGMTDQEKAEYDELALAAKEDGITIEEEKTKKAAAKSKK